MSIVTCLCGKEFDSEDYVNKKYPFFNWHQHNKNCKEYKKYKIETCKDILENYKEEIIKKYTEEGYSILDLIKQYPLLCPVKGVYENDIWYLHHEFFSDLFKENNVFHVGISLRNKKKMEKSISTNLERYGVINVGCLPDHKAKLMAVNKINPFQSKEFGILEYIKGKRAFNQEKFDEYKKEVTLLTNRNKKLLPKINKCFYTGLYLFQGKEYDYNMFFYATVDHKFSVLNGFLNNISAEKISDISNLCWCCRFVNTVKKEKNYEEFIISEEFSRIQNILPELRIMIEEYLNES